MSRLTPSRKRAISSPQYVGWGQCLQTEEIDESAYLSDNSGDLNTSFMNMSPEQES